MAVEVEEVFSDNPSIPCRARSGHIAKSPNHDCRKTILSAVTGIDGLDLSVTAVGAFMGCNSTSGV